MYDELLRSAIGRQPAEDTCQPLPIFPDDREHRAGLNDDLEHFGRVAVEVQQIANENEMPGGRHRKEFCEAFDNSQQHRFQEQADVHRQMVVEAGGERVCCGHRNLLE